MNFYAIIIGTEILNGRRQDKHFEFLRDTLANYGHTLFASFVIKDDATLIKRTFEMVLQDPNSVMFSFGGIGSTPDDLTREIASQVFCNAPTQRHPQFFQDIIERFDKEAYPHRIHMADLPPGATLLHNPVNNMSGFALQNRFFFVPGFPSMAHPMIKEVITRNFSITEPSYRKTLIAHTSENTLISLMQQLPSSIELSSLPLFKDGTPFVELSLSGKDLQALTKAFEMFQKSLKEKNIKFEITQN